MSHDTGEKKESLFLIVRIKKIPFRSRVTEAHPNLRQISMALITVTFRGQRRKNGKYFLIAGVFFTHARALSLLLPLFSVFPFFFYLHLLAVFFFYFIFWFRDRDCARFAGGPASSPLSSLLTTVDSLLSCQTIINHSRCPENPRRIIFLLHHLAQTFY